MKKEKMTKQQLLDYITELEDELAMKTARLEEIEESNNEQLEQRNQSLAELEDDFHQFITEFNRFVNGESCPNHIRELEYLTKTIEKVCWN